MSKYWNNEGAFQAEFNQLTEQLMPASGSAETLGGELVRSANRLYYDAFNNGFLNNTSGAINFIRKYMLPVMRDEDLKEAVDYIEPKTNTGGYSSTGAMTGAALDTIVDKTVEFFRLFPEVAAQPCPEDMLALSDDDHYEEYEEDEYED